MLGPMKHRNELRVMMTLRLFSRTSSQPVELTPFSQRFFSGGGHGRSNNWLPGILRNHVEVPNSSKIFHGFRTFCSVPDLSSKKCVACNSGDMRPMTEQAASELITKVSGWEIVKEEGKLKLRKSWKVKSFTKGLELFQAVSVVAEDEGHHPDLHLVGWNNVIIEIFTHKVGGLTENDFILAAKINKIDLAPLLRRQLS